MLGIAAMEVRIPNIYEEVELLMSPLEGEKWAQNDNFRSKFEYIDDLKKVLNVRGEDRSFMTLVFSIGSRPCDS